ncbi:hypothetical protein VP01_12630g1, partial [Puccinia sorghi]
DDALLIWKSINEYFASQHAANRARVWNHESIKTRTSWHMKLLKKLPKTPEFTSISTAITHSGSTITPDLVLDHLRLHANQLAIETSAQSSSSQKQVSFFSDASKKCKYKAHNTLANNPESRCWKLYPHLRPDYLENSKAKDQAEHSVSSFFSTQSTH